MSQEKTKGKLVALAEKAERQAEEFENLAKHCTGPKKAEAFRTSANTYRQRAADYRQQAEGAPPNGN